MSTKRRQCRNNPDVFCYICSEYMMAKYRFNVRYFTKRAYEAYFGMKLADQDKCWAPHKVCKHCTEMLRFWTQDKVSSMQFGMIFIFAWWICMDGISERRKIGIILILILLDDPYRNALKFQFQFLLPYLTLLQMKCYRKRWMILIAVTVVLVVLPAWLLLNLYSVQNQNSLVKAN